MKRAVFLDRDNTIISESGFTADAAGIELIPGAAEAIKRLNRAGFLVIVISNQSGVARGYFTAGQVKRFHEALSEKLAAKGARIDAYYFCPHHPTEGVVAEYAIDCGCRKPKPGMLLEAAAEADVDCAASYVIGDSVRDIEAGLGAGVKAAFFLGSVSDRGSGLNERAIAVRDLAEAVDIILPGRLILNSAISAFPGT